MNNRWMIFATKYVIWSYFITAEIQQIYVELYDLCREGVSVFAAKCFCNYNLSF